MISGGQFQNLCRQRMDPVDGAPPLDRTGRHIGDAVGLFGRDGIR